MNEIQDIIREMRETSDEIANAGISGFGNRCSVWADTLEDAMQEPVGELTEVPMGEIKFQQLRDCDAGPLYALPPDAAGEVKMLQKQLKWFEEFADLAVARGNEVDRQHAKIERLRTLLAELADLMDGVLDGEYTPDQFTTQPARTALAEDK
jgi:hypothetical protein